MNIMLHFWFSMETVAGVIRHKAAGVPISNRKRTDVVSEFGACQMHNKCHATDTVAAIL